MAIHLARKKVRVLRKQMKARVCLQSRFRGYRTRKRTYWIFKRLYFFYSKIGHLAHKLLVISRARYIHRLILATQGFARMVPKRATYWRVLRGVRELQKRVRFRLDGGRPAKLAAEARARADAHLRKLNSAARVMQ
jgi:hypothetical protein